MIRLALDGLRHYWRLSFCLFLGVFTASAILTGSLLVGDSVKQTLRNNAGLRVGPVNQAILTGERFITQSLVERVAVALPGKVTAAALVTPGVISTPDKRVRVNGVRVYGVTDAFWKLAGMDVPGDEYLALGEPLANRLKLTPGAPVITRMEMPGRVSREAPLSGETEEIVSINGPVTHIIDAQNLGKFSLSSGQTDALNVFVPLQLLQDKLDKAGRVNLVLSTADENIQPVLEGNWSLADVELSLKRLTDSRSALFSDRVFISHEVERAVLAGCPGSEGILTYLVNDFYHDEFRVPYSVIVGIGATGASRLGVDVPGPGEIIVNDWLGLAPEDGGLSLVAEDSVGISFFAVDNSREFLVVGDGKSPSGEPDPGDSVSFIVSGVINRDAKVLADGWVPEFPGLETAQSLATWESGLPINTSKIRDSDELFWDKYKASPKAFVSLSQAQQLWGNRFGKVTGIRLEQSGIDEDALVSVLRSRLKLSELGISVREVSTETRDAVEGALDFGMLFASLSGFLVISAIMLVALLCVFGMESRSTQIGLLGAIGFTPRLIHRLFLYEATVVCLAGAIIGAFGGVGYTKLALIGLSGVWKDAAAGVEFAFHARATSIFSGAGVIFIVALASIYIAGRKLASRVPRSLLANDSVAIGEMDSPRRKIFLCVSIFCGACCAGGLVWLGLGLEGEKLAGTFFGAGFLMLLSGIGVFLLVVGRERGQRHRAFTLAGLACSNLLRKKGRSLSVVGMVSGGVFLVSAVNAFRLSDESSTEGRESGTGGFHFVGTTSLPVYEDLNNMKVRDKFGLEDFSNQELAFVQMRVGKGGEEASCLNLSHTTRPRIVGVDPRELSSRKAFRFASSEPFDPAGSPWDLLVSNDETAPIPVIGDKASVMWSLKKNLGSSFFYPDGRGGEVELKIVGLLENSVMQGNLLISDDAFKRIFPDSGGYQFFLVDAAGNTPLDDISAEVMKSLERQGMSLESTARRLAAYSRVQNTYITIFTVLGGLGTLLGTVGVGILIARNVIERRGELAVMKAIGFRNKSLIKMLLSEHSTLLLAGVVIGLIASLLTISPNLLDGSTAVPLVGILFISALISVGGVFFCLLASSLALRGSFRESITKE